MDMTGVYINEAIENAFASYLNSKDHKGTLEYNTFLCTIVRLLLLIFGEEIILDYQTRNPATLIYTMNKYGTVIEDANNFTVIVDKFYQMEKKQKDKAIRKKNKYFNAIQKFLIDMFINRGKQQPLKKKEIKEFYNLLFTANSKSFYRKSTALVLALDPYEIDEYYKKQILGEMK